jgi:TetR/AcrR family transcriptional regulator, transcriptional repressor of bet genes
MTAVSSPQASPRPQTAAPGGSRSRQRQRQRLIDACISALHIHGPSHTTVEKVVALADLSPGIVRFYFDSKDAMLVASLEHLAAEFQERVLQPVTRLKDSPVEALQLLVKLYLDADIASPRKVSVWYSFWGEASSRQEYLDICGKKDEEFAVLVRELIERLIAASGATHLDADAVALGLIGVLEVLWQGFAFQSEADIDRTAALSRSLKYLRSVFPGQFRGDDPAVAAAPIPAWHGAPGRGGRLPARAYTDDSLLAAEREQLLRPAWQLLGHEAEVPGTGDFLSGDPAGERALVVRGEGGRLYAFRNTCRRRPHALLAPRKGRLRGAIRCLNHSLTYSFDGRLTAGATPGDLTPLEIRRAGRLILVRAGGAAPGAALPPAPWESFRELVPRLVTEHEASADWKLLVEQWLEASQPEYHFVGPNLLLDVGTEGAIALQVTPLAAGRCRIRRFDFVVRGTSGKAARATWQRRMGRWLRAQIALAESTQAGLAAGAEEPAEAGPVAPALAQFRAAVATLLLALPA